MRKNNNLLSTFYSTIFILMAVPVLSQDSVSLRLVDAEKIFLEKNFLLLAAKYDVQAADAAIIQQRLYPNPFLAIDQGAFNPKSGTWFDASKTGQTEVSLQQVILLAGKRSKQVELAKINSELAQFQFSDLIRTLRFELRTSFYGLHFLRQSISVYDREINLLMSLIDTYTLQYHKGNVPFKELARLQALQFSLENERIALMKEATEKQSTLLLLTGDTLARPVKTILENNAPAIEPGNLIYDNLIESGLANRFDLLAAQKHVSLSQSNFALQRAYRVPDVLLGAHYDRAGNYIYNYNAISLGLALPLWNRNQGNIRIAQYQIESHKRLQSLKEQQVKSEIGKALVQLSETDKLYKTVSIQFNADYEKLLDGITLAYQEHTISLLEFIDYYETYKNSKIEFNHLQNNRFNALENLNLATGTQLY